jgi:hypothetical protein
MRNFSLISLLSILFASTAFAQNSAPIERIKITDNDLSCRQLFDELGSMDKVIAEAKTAQSSNQTTATAGQAAGVAAEVATRTGIFGALGGLGGHLLGSVASKAAANVAEQKGQQGVAQAAETEKQALGRKEHLTSVFLAKGCSASDPSAAAKTPNASIPLPKPEVAAVPKTTEQAIQEAASSLNPLTSDVALKNDIPTEMRGLSKVVVPQFRVAFVAKTSVSARGGAGLSNLGQSTGYNRTITQAQSKRVDMMLGNVDYELMQAITERLYTDFIARLKAAGKDVVTLEELKQSSGYAKMKFLPNDKPYTKSPFDDGREFIFATPKELPLAFMHMDTHLGNSSPFEQDTTKAIAEVAAKLNAVALMPTVIIDFAELESSGNSRFATSASAEATPKVGIAANTLLIAMTGKDVKIFFAGDARFARLEKPVFTEGDFGTVKPVKSFDNIGLANTLTALSGTQGTQYSYEKRLLSADPVLYASKVFQAGATINQAFVAGLKP